MAEISLEAFENAMRQPAARSAGNFPNIAWEGPLAPTDGTARILADASRLPSEKPHPGDLTSIDQELRNPHLSPDAINVLQGERAKVQQGLSRGEIRQPLQATSQAPKEVSVSFEAFQQALGSSSDRSIDLSSFAKAFSQEDRPHDANPFEAAASAAVDIKGQSLSKTYFQSMVAPFEVAGSLIGAIPEFVLGAAGGGGAAAGALAHGKLPTQKDIDEGMHGGAPQWAKELAQALRPRTAAGRLLNAPVEAALDAAITGGGRILSMPAAQWATIKEAIDNKWSLNRLVQTFKKTSDDITPLTTALLGLGLAGKMGTDAKKAITDRLEERAERKLQETQKQAVENQKRAVWENAQKDLESQIRPFEEPKVTPLPEAIEFQKPLFPEPTEMAGEVPRRMQAMEETPREFTDRPSEVGQTTSRAGEPYEMAGRESPRQMTEQLTIEEAIRQSLEQERVDALQRRSVETMNERAPSPQEGALGPFDQTPRPRESVPLDPSERPISDYGSVGEARAQAMEKRAAENVQNGLNRDGIPIEGSQIPLAFTARGRREGGFIGFRNQAKKEGVARALVEASKQNAYDTRPLREIAAEAIKNGFTNIIPYRNWMDTGQIGRLSRNPLFGAVAQRAFKIDRWKDITFKDLIDGTSFVKGISGRERRVPSADGALTLIRQMSKARGDKRAQLFEMKEKWLASVSKAQLTRADFKTDLQWQAFDAAQKVHDKALKIVNDQRALHNPPLPPIPRTSNFYPYVRTGDFMVRAIDKNGKTILATGRDSPLMARLLQRSWEKELKDKGGGKVTVEAIDPRRFKDQGDFLSFVLQLNAELGKQGHHELAGTLSSAAEKIVGRKVAGGHFLKKNTDIGGYMGSEFGMKGIRNLEKAIEGYVYQILQYTANLKKNHIREELAGLPKEIKDAQEGTISAASEFLDKVSGKDTSQAKVIDNFAMNLSMELTKMTGNWSPVGGATLPRRMIRGMNGLVFPYLLLTARSFIQNMTQFTSGIPRLSKMKATGEIKGDVPVGSVISHELRGLGQWILPDAKHIEAYNWAQREGWMDATVGKMMDFKWGDTPTTNPHAIKELLKLPLTVVDKHMVRSLLFATFETALRDTIKNDKERWQKAAFEMNDVAVDYHPSHTPMIYDRLGLAGEATKGLKSFFHNQLGSIVDYVKFAKETRELGPITWALATMATIGGLKGMIGVKEVDTLIDWLNAIRGTSYKTLSQWFTANPDLPDIAVNGVVSAGLGYDMTNSLSAPNAKSFFSAPGIEVTAKAVGASIDYLEKKFSGKATEQDAYRTLLATTPANMHGSIDNYFMGPDNMVRDPNHKMQPIYQRSRGEKIVAGLFSLRSTRNSSMGLLVPHFEDHFQTGTEKFRRMGEAQRRELIRDTRDLAHLDDIARKEIMDAIIDRYKEGKSADDLIEKLEEAGGDTRAGPLNRNLRKRLNEQDMTYDEILERGRNSPRKNHRLERSEQLREIPARRNEPQSSIPQDSNIRPVADTQTAPQSNVARPWEDTGKMSPNGTRMPVVLPGDRHNRMPVINKPRDQYRTRRVI